MLNPRNAIVIGKVCMCNFKSFTRRGLIVGASRLESSASISLTELP